MLKLTESDSAFDLSTNATNSTIFRGWGREVRERRGTEGERGAGVEGGRLLEGGKGRKVRFGGGMQCQLAGGSYLAHQVGWWYVW